MSLTNKDIPIEETFELNIKVKCVTVDFADCLECVGYGIPECNLYLGECRAKKRFDNKNVIYVINEDVE